MAPPAEGHYPSRRHAGGRRGLASGERRKGLYAGSFTFLRKLGGAGAVTVAGIVLDLAGGVRAAADHADHTGGHWAD